MSDNFTDGPGSGADVDYDDPDTRPMPPVPPPPYFDIQPGDELTDPVYAPIDDPTAQAELDAWLAAAPSEREQEEAAEAVELETEIRNAAGKIMQIFAQNGFRLWKFKTLRYYRHRDYKTFDAWLADPENKLSSSSAHLSVQMVDLVWANFLITQSYIAAYNDKYSTHVPTAVWEHIGERKFQIIIPQIQAIADDYEEMRAQFRGDSNRLEKNWQRYRREVLEWLIKGWSMSATDLTNDTKYRAGWQTYFSSPMPAATLRGMSREDLLNILCPMDAPETVVITVRGRIEKIAKFNPESADVLPPIE